MKELLVLSNGIIKLESIIWCNKPSIMYRYAIKKVDTNEFIGVCAIRLAKTIENYYLGNVEYKIYEPYRGNNYALEATKLMANVSKYYNVYDLTITANPNNIASIRTIEKLGARFIEVGKIPKKHQLYKRGERYVSIYEWNIKKEGDKDYDRYKINKRK